MSILELDKKGRLTLPKDIRESLEIGKKVLIINAGDHLKIIPYRLTLFKSFTAHLTLKNPSKN